MNEPCNVRAVMKKAIEHLEHDNIMGTPQRELVVSLCEARAAVAELIEAVRLYRRARFLNAKSEHGDRAAIARELGLDEYSGLLTIQCEAFDRVETTLARVGGA